MSGCANFQILVSELRHFNTTEQTFTFITFNSRIRQREPRLLKDNKINNYFEITFPLCTCI
jgi:hypothetical protein